MENSKWFVSIKTTNSGFCLFWPCLNQNRSDLAVEQGYWGPTLCFTVNPTSYPRTVGCREYMIQHGPKWLTLQYKDLNSVRSSLKKEDNLTIQLLSFSHLYWINWEVEKIMEQTYRHKKRTRSSFWEVFHLLLPGPGLRLPALGSIGHSELGFCFR